MKRMLAVLSLVAMAAASPSQVPTEDEAFAARLRTIHASRPTLGGRIEAVSESLLGVAYRLGPLGEGPTGEFDSEPLADLREFDCTTYVEHVMAMALEPDLRKALDVTLQKIRYKGGVVSYETRNHFTELDWVPNNIAAGFLKDITEDVAPGVARTVTKRISKRRWYETKTIDDIQGFPDTTPADKQARLRRLQALGSRYEDRSASIPYVPLEALPALLDKIPSGTIANLVRADAPDKATLISHQILLVRKDGRTYVRHAAYGRQVEDALAADYLARYAHSAWPLLGLDLNALTAPTR